MTGEIKVDNKPFQPGDVVQLMSGGPAMTVCGRDPSGDIYVQYFSTAGVLTNGKVDAECLRQVSAVGPELAKGKK